MKNWKFKISIIIMIILIVATIGGIKAYMTDLDSTINVFSIGNIELQLQTSNWNGTTNTASDSITTKNPSVYNSGTTDAYVYVTVDVPYYSYVVQTLSEGNASIEIKLFQYEINENWIEIECQKDDVNKMYKYLYAYAKNENALIKLSAGETTNTVFDKIQFTDMFSGDDINMSNADVIINVYGIESDSVSYQENENDTFAKYLWSVIKKKIDLG